MNRDAVAWPGRDGAPISAAAARMLAASLQVVADPARLRILSLLASHEPRPSTVSELVTELEISQPTVSHHLKQLHEAGLVTLERAGSWSLYRADADAYAALLARIAPH